MSYARYYFKRSSKESDKPVVFATGTPWEWAMVRGVGADGKQLAGINFTGSHHQAKLTLVVSGAHTELVGSRYEVVLGDAGEDPGKFRHKLAEAALAGAGIGIDPGDVMDRDPPPPPKLDWDFGPNVIIK